MKPQYKKQKANLKKWIKALRSGKYKQTKDTLCNDKRNSFCCLGVLCDVLKIPYTVDDDGHRAYDAGSTSTLTAGAGAHDENLNDPMRVLQLNVPLVCRYSVVYQNVQSSTGSTVIEL